MKEVFFPLWYAGRRVPTMESRWDRDQNSHHVKASSRFIHSYYINMEDDGFERVMPCNTRVLIIQLERMQAEEPLYNMCTTLASHTSAVIFSYGHTSCSTHRICISLVVVSHSPSPPPFPLLPQSTSLNCRHYTSSTSKEIHLEKPTKGPVERVKPQGRIESYWPLI